MKITMEVDKLPDNFTGMMECPEGHRSYYLNGLKHRAAGPAVERTNGYKEYWIEGKLHRLDGPASEWIDGGKEYWVESIQYSEEDFSKKKFLTPDPCLGKVVEIDGLKYQMTLVQE